MPGADRPIAEVLHDIVGNLQDIVRSEVRLARTEFKEEVAKTRSAAVLLAAAALMAIFATLFVLMAIVYAMSDVMPRWAAALIVAAVVGITAAACVYNGIKKLRTIRGAPKTAASMKENVEWAKQLTK
jgi:uncharacterized membrane protein YqjE